MTEPLRILPAAHIDRKRWDDCVHAHDNGLIYSRSNFLDAMTDQWHGIVKGDYEAVMPIPWRRKFGCRYAYIPAFTQQLGITGKVSSAEMEEMIAMLKRFVSLADVHFNFSNDLPAAAACVTFRNNMVLSLRTAAEERATGYHENLRTALRKATAYGLQYVAENDVSVPVQAFRNLYGARLHRVAKKDYEKLEKMAQQMQVTGHCFAAKVLSPSGDLLAAALLLRDNKRVYNLVNAVFPRGRQLFANHYLLHSVMNEVNGDHLLFDFEGSEQKGIHAFFASFGAIAQPYPYYHYNGLPAVLRWLRR